MVTYTARRLWTWTHFLSDQATHATARLRLQVGAPLRSRSVPQRGPQRILCLVSHHAVHDGALYGAAIHVIRVDIQSHEPNRAL